MLGAAQHSDAGKDAGLVQPHIQLFFLGLDAFHGKYDARTPISGDSIDFFHVQLFGGEHLAKFVQHGLSVRAGHFEGVAQRSQ